CAVGAEVHEHHRVAVGDGGAVADDGRCHELVVLATRVGGLQGFAGGCGVLFRARFHDRIPGPAHAVPALVAVHGVVATADAGDAHARGGAVRGVATCLQRFDAGA